MKREDLIESMQKHSFNFFPREWYEKVVDNVFLELKGKTNVGYVYFVKYGSSEAIKIGMSSNIVNRIKSFQTTNSDELYLIGYVYTGDYVNLEKSLHFELKDFRLSGEWFNLNLNICMELITKNQGVIVNSKVDKKLIIEDGVLVSCSNEKINDMCNDLYLSNLFDKIERGIRYKTGVYFESLPKEAKDNYSKKKISLSLKKYAKQSGLKYFSGNTNGMRWFILE